MSCKRFTAAVLSAALTATLVGSTASAAGSGNDPQSNETTETTTDARPSWAERFERIRYRSLEWPRTNFSTFENQLTVHAAAVRFGISEGRMICIVQRESGWNEHAYNASSGASGLFQHLRSYWYGRVAAYRAWAPPKLQIKAGASPFSARANVLVSARLMAMGQWFHWASTDSPC